MELAERFLSPIQVPQVSMFSGCCSITVETKRNFILLHVLQSLDSDPQASRDLPVKALLLRLDNNNVLQKGSSGAAACLVGEGLWFCCVHGC